MKRRFAALLTALILIIGCLPTVSAAGGASTIANGGDKFFAVGEHGTLYGWGYNEDGVLSDEIDGGVILTPIAIMEGVTAVERSGDEIVVTRANGSTATLCRCSVTASDDFSLVGGTVYDKEGEALLSDVRAMDTNAGGIHLALNGSGELLAWGFNTSLLLGSVTYNMEVTEPVVMLSGILLPGAEPVEKEGPPALPLPTPWIPPVSDPKRGEEPQKAPELPSYLDTLDEGVVGAEPSFWAVEEVDMAIELGILPQAMRCRYTEDITRLEFCVLVKSAIEAIIGADTADYADSRDLEAAEPFDDTPYAEARDMARLKIVEGVGDGRFDPDSPITREDAATMLRRAAAALDLELAAVEYETDEHIDVWAREGVDYVTTVGIMKGKGDGVFDPLANYTREEAVLTLVRLYGIAK